MRLENLAALAGLQTLNAAHNLLGSEAGAADVAHLRECPSLTCLDLQENKLDDAAVLDVLADLPALAVLYLQGNPCVRKIRFYRKHVIGRLPQLKFLDDRPVFPDERARCDVWYRVWIAEGEAAAAAAERAEIERLAREKSEHEERNFQAFATFTARAAAGDPNAFQAFQPEWQARHAPSGGSGSGGGEGEAEAKKEEELDEEEGDEDEEGGEGGDGGAADGEEGLGGGEEAAAGGAGGQGEAAGKEAEAAGAGAAAAAGVSAAMRTETPQGAEARRELWERVVAVSGGAGGAPASAPASAPAATDVEELE